MTGKSLLPACVSKDFYPLYTASYMRDKNVRHVENNTCMNSEILRHN